MFFCLLGAALAALFLYLAFNTKLGNPESSFGLVFLISVLCFVIGIFAPISGYKEPVITKEIELVSLSNDVASEGGGMIFVKITAGNVYSYRQEVESDYATENGKTYVVKSVSENAYTNIFEVEEGNRDKAILKVYESMPKRNFFTFAILGSTSEEYVFYVPAGTIQNDITLK